MAAGIISCGIALGSNLGDRLANLRAARKRIVASPEWITDTPIAMICASIYESSPVDCPPGSGSFLNTVLETQVQPDISPLAILHRLQSIEQALGRPSQHPKNAPRSIDLDLLYLGENRLTTPELTLPHPRLLDRGFVLAPLAEIRPDLVLPGCRTSIGDLWQASFARDSVVRLQSIW